MSLSVVLSHPVCFLQESHADHMTTQTTDETPAMTSERLNYENGYQEQRHNKGVAPGDYVPQASLPATQEAMAPPPPAAPSPIME